MVLNIKELHRETLEKVGLDNPDVVAGLPSGTKIDVKPKTAAKRTEVETDTRTKICEFCGDDIPCTKKGDYARHVRWCPNRPGGVNKRHNPKATPKKKTVLARCEKDKDAIIADYSALPLREFYKKWKLNSKYLGQLKKLWKIKPKGRGGDRRVNQTTGIASVQQNAETRKDRRIKEDGKPAERHVTVHVYLGDAFPKFSECHCTEERVEWLRVYRDLTSAVKPIALAVKEAIAAEETVRLAA